MVRRLILSAACVGVACAHDAPNLEREGDEYVLVGQEEPTRSVAHGGGTDPPDLPNTGPWILTGRRQYIWRINVTEPVEGGLQNPHPLDGTVSESDTLEVPCDKAGCYEVTVSLQEEWQDTSHPQTILFWPLRDDELLPEVPQTEGEFAAQKPAPPPIMPAFPLVPPLVAAEERK